MINFLNNGIVIPIILILTLIQKNWSQDQEAMTQFLIASTVFICNIGVIMVIFLAKKPDFDLFNPREQTAGSTIGLALFNLIFP